MAAVYTTFVNSYAVAREPAHNDDCGPFPEKAVHP